MKTTELHDPALNMAGIRKAFPGVQALGQASLVIHKGEIHALVGENGAGKSTLIKILTGVHRADAGSLTLFGEPAEFTSPLQAQKAGIATVYQEFTLIPALSVRANLFLGRERSRRGVIDTTYERRETRRLFDRLGVSINPETPVAELNTARQQLVEIARTLVTEARILVLDEPTAALTPREVDHLFAVLRELGELGIGIVFISHRLDEVFAIADRVTVMRDGNTIGTWPTAELTKRQLIEQMVGRPLDQEFPQTKVTTGKPCLVVKNLTGSNIRDLSFVVNHGEVLGLAGLMGAGRTDVARLIFGADPKKHGTVILDDRVVKTDSPRQAIASGICLLTEDRKTQGLILRASARDNFALPNLVSWSRLGWINRRRENTRFLNHVDKLRIRISGPEQLAENLSGGNQQKLLIARWLETKSRVLIFDEPTRGIDVGAKYEMYVLIKELAAQGKAVIVISSELPELLGICTRIIVMRENHITGEIADVTQATQEQIMALAV